MADSLLLELRDWSVLRGDRVLINRLNWQVARGQVWSVIGVNGCGKSSLLRALAGLPLASAFQLQGELLWQGRVPKDYRRKDRAGFVSWMAQSDASAFDCTVTERLLAGLYPQGHALGWESRADLAFISKALARFDLDGFEDRSVASLSGGERRRISLAAAQLQGSSLVLLDEPMSQLDWAHQVQIGEAFRQWPELSDRALVWVTHEPNMAMRYSTHLLAITADGEVLQGPICDMAKPAVLERVYGCQIEGSLDPFLFFPVTKHQ